MLGSIRLPISTEHLHSEFSFTESWAETTGPLLYHSCRTIISGHTIGQFIISFPKIRKWVRKDLALMSSFHWTVRVHLKYMKIIVLTTVYSLLFYRSKIFWFRYAITHFVFTHHMRCYHTWVITSATNTFSEPIILLALLFCSIYEPHKT